MMSPNKVLNPLERAQQQLESGFSHLPNLVRYELDEASLSAILNCATKLHDNFPYQHPLYIGQMLKPPHALAQAAYTLAMTLNPNNHAHDGGRASSEMEKACIQQLGTMIGWNNPLGHLCSGGTIANFEALWIARELNPQTTILASSMSHYTHQRLSAVLQISFEAVAVDQAGRMEITALEHQLQQLQLQATAAPATVVATLGTTGMGAVDPLPQILKLQQRYKFRLHIDAAYGGYFNLVKELSPETRAAFAMIHQADSFVIDPHKHGLQPYGCGCVLFRDPTVAAIYKHESPYTYFSSNDLHLGEISLECSRAGAAAVALWATMARFPLVADGEFAQGLTKGRQAALLLYNWLLTSETFVPITIPDLDVVVWTIKAQSASESSTRARDIFAAAATHDLHLALIKIERTLLEPLNTIQTWDSHEVTCLRACVMKPEHLEWMPEILTRLAMCLTDV